MKTYEEMAQSVLTRIEEYEIEKQNKRRRVKKAAIVSVPVCAAVVAAAGIFHGSIVGNNRNIPIAETGKSVVSAVSQAERKLVSSAVNTQAESSEKSSDIAYSENNDSSSKSDKNQKTESTAANTPYYENSDSDSFIVYEESTSSSGVINTPYYEDESDNNADKDAQTESTQSIIESDEEENFDPEPGFEDTGDALGMIYKDGVMYMQFSVYDDGFTLDENIGAASEFDGTYKYIRDVTGDVYTVKESRDVLIVKLSNGGTVALARAGQLIVNGTPYCSTMLDTNVYLADEFLGHVSDFETVDVPYLNYEIELSPNDDVYTVADKDEGTLCIKQENGNAVIFVSML